MSHIVTEARVNQFLPQEKLDIPDGELHTVYYGEELENTIWGIARAKLFEYDISGWLSATNKPVPSAMPNIVLDIVAMWVAGAIYNKQFAEESSDTGDTYGSKLKDDALSLLGGIVDRTLVIDGLEASEADLTKQPSVWETEPIFVVDSEF